MAALEIDIERWPIAGTFTISRGSKTEAAVIVARVSDGTHTGRGECVPYSRYGESLDSVRAALEEMAPAVAKGLDRDALAKAMPPGAARNALDCALWDLESKQKGVPVWQLASLPKPHSVQTVYTISLDEPARMADAARAATDRPMLKIKLGGLGDDLRVAAVREAAPDAVLTVDANEAWTVDLLKEYGPKMADLGVRLIEQPLPAGHDAALEQVSCPVPLCADESFHDLKSLDSIASRYQVLNLKLDKTGGLTEAIHVLDAIRERNMELFVGCMVGTSLAMAPAFLLAGTAEFVDLDGPLLLAQDRKPGLTYEGSVIHPSTDGLWGGL